MPKGRPKKGYRRAGGGRKKGSAAVVTLTVRGARSQTLTRCTKKTAATKLSMQERDVLRSNIESLTNDQLDHLFQFLGYQDTDGEASIDLERMDGTEQRALVKFVDGLCAAAIAHLQGKVNRLAADQLEEIITFLGADLGGGDVQ